MPYDEFIVKVQTMYSKAYQRMLNKLYIQYPEQKKDVKRLSGCEKEYLLDLASSWWYEELGDTPTQSEVDKLINSIVDLAITVQTIEIKAKLNTAE